MIREHAPILAHTELLMACSLYSKTCVKRPLSKRQKIGFEDQLLLMQVIAECIQPPFVIKIFVWSIFEWQFYTGFPVYELLNFRH